MPCQGGEIRPWDAAHFLDLSLLVGGVDIDHIHSQTRFPIWFTALGTVLLWPEQPAHQSFHDRATKRSRGRGICKPVCRDFTNTIEEEVLDFVSQQYHPGFRENILVLLLIVE